MDMSQFLPHENEKPLDRLAINGGYCSILRTIACVGDSLSSGEFETIKEDGTHGYHDHFEHSWGQYLARMCGSKVLNFSRGGMTAKEYCGSFADAKDFWNPDKKCQAYIIALGVNDIFWQKHEIGSINDIDFENYNNNKPTVIGNYAKIVQRYKEIQPEAKFFFVTVANEYEDNPELRERVLNQVNMVYELNKAFPDSYVIDLFKYGPKFDNEFKNKFYLHGHMNPCGYNLLANIFTSYIDYIIRHNMDDFTSIGFIETNL